MTLNRKLLQTLKWLFIYNIPVCLFVIASLPSVGDLFIVLIFALFLSVMVLSGPLGMLYIADTLPQPELSIVFALEACVIILPFILYPYWLKVESAPLFLLHLAVVCWVGYGGSLAFFTMAQSV